MTRYLLSRRMLANLFVLAFLAVWFVTLAPTAVRGPAGYIEVSGNSMDGTYKTGDLIVTRKQDTYATGDIITFEVPNGPGTSQVIHRITGGDGVTGYTTQGDNNPDADPWHPTDAEVVGKAWHRFEGQAWILHLPRQPWFAGVTAGLLTLVVLGIDAIPRRRRSDVEDSSPSEAPELVGAATAPAGDQSTGGKIPAQRTDSVPNVIPLDARGAARQATRESAQTRRRPSTTEQPSDPRRRRP